VVRPLLLPRGLVSVCFSSEGDSGVSFLSFSGGGMLECAVQFWCLLRYLVPVTVCCLLFSCVLCGVSGSLSSPVVWLRTKWRGLGFALICFSVSND
jgi:hypothetical protein